MNENKKGKFYGGGIIFELRLFQNTLSAKALAAVGVALEFTNPGGKG